MASFYGKEKDFLRLCNAIQGDATRLDSAYNDYDSIKEETWLKNHKSFDNLGGMRDEELGTESPVIQLGCVGITQNDVNRGQVIAPDRNTEEYHYFYGYSTGADPYLIGSKSANNPLEIRTQNVEQFDRIAMYIPMSDNVSLTLSRYSPSLAGFPLYDYSNITMHGFDCRKILNGEITYVELASFLGSENLRTIDEQHQLRFYRYMGNQSPASNPTSYRSIFWGFPFDTNFGVTTNIVGANYSNVWIFETRTDCDDYLRTGDYSKAINYHNDYIPIVDTITTKGKKYYWYQHAFSKNNSKSSKNYINSLSFDIEIDLTDTASRTLAIQRIFSGVNTSDCDLMINNYDDILEVRYRDYGTQEWEVHPISFLFTLTLIYRTLRSMTSGTYSQKLLGSDLITNIPVFYRDGEAEKFFDEEIDIDSAVNSEDLHYFDDINQNGDNTKLQSELNEINTANNMSEILELSTGFLSQFSTFLSNSNEMDNILNGLKLRGGNPISFIVDLFALPFKIDNFVVKQSENDMYFGTYQHTFSSSFNKIVRTNILKNVFSTFIMPIFNDWRDYLTNVYIYLPYVNIQPLKYEEIINKTLSCKVGVDVTTGTIKYFIFTNGVMIQTFEGSVRQNAPISATDYYGSSMTKIDGASQIVQGVAQGITGNPQGLISFAKGGGNLLKQPPKSITGNYSSSTAFFDELNAYLIYEQTNVLYPQTIINKYNLPNNMVGKLSACIGYTEIDDIDLQIDCDENIKDKIISILKSGFYID